MTTTTARKYNPGFLSDDELVSSFCVRTHEFESLMEMLRGCTGNPNQHQIVIGPRGSGKTSLLLRIAAEVRRDADLAASFFPVVFAEESYEVSTAGEFWLECLARLAHQAPQREDAPDLLLTVADLRTIQDDQLLGERCLAAVLDFADREDKRLVLMVENLNMMFLDMMDPDAGWRLRKVLQTEPRIILLASATSRFDQIDHPDHALYEMLRIVTLRRLTTKECAVLWKTVSGQSRPTNTIRSLEILTGGSPRLLAIVARFGVGRSFGELMDNLLDLVDDHTEYFKSHLESLPPQERRVYLALADLWEPALTKEIAERARLDTSKCSAQLTRLVDCGAVLVTGGSARRKQYYLSERMYNIYYLLRRNRGPERVIDMLIQFMAAYYSPDEQKEIGTRIALEAEDAVPEIRSLYQYASAKLLAMSEQTYRSEVGCTVSVGGPSEDSQLRAAMRLARRADTLWERGENEETLVTLHELIGRFGETEAQEVLGLVARAHVNRGTALGVLGRSEEQLVTYDEMLSRFGDSEMPELLVEVARAFVNKGAALGASKRVDAALAVCDEMLDRFGDTEVPELLEHVARALFNKGVSLSMLGRRDEALVIYEEVRCRFTETESPRIHELLASALINKGTVLGALNRPEEELAAYDELLSRFGGSEVPELLEQVANALVNRGVVLSAAHRWEEALATHDEVLRRFGDSDAQILLDRVARSLVSKGVTLTRLNRREEAIAVYDEVLRRFGEGEVPSLVRHTANALMNKSLVFAELNRPDQPSDISALLAVVPKLDAPKRAIGALTRLSIDIGPERMLRLIQASPAAEFLRPLTTALERELGQHPRVPEEVSEVAEDIRRDLAKIREAWSLRGADALRDLQQDAARRGLDELSMDEIDEEIRAFRKGRKDG